MRIQTDFGSFGLSSAGKWVKRFPALIVVMVVIRRFLFLVPDLQQAFGRQNSRDVDDRSKPSSSPLHRPRQRCAQVLTTYLRPEFV